MDKTHYKWLFFQYIVMLNYQRVNRHCLGDYHISKPWLRLIQAAARGGESQVLETRGGPPESCAE